MKKGGRTKGTPNKVTQEIRECYNQLLSNNSDKLQTWIDEVAKDNPAKALDVILKLSVFILPKMNRVSIESENQNVINMINLGKGQMTDEELDAEIKLHIPLMSWAEEKK